MGTENLENRAPTFQNRAQQAPREGLGGLLGRLVATLKTKLAPTSVWEASWGESGKPLGLGIWGVGARFKVFGSHFLHTFEMCGLHFFNNLGLMLKHFLH